MAKNARKRIGVISYFNLNRLDSGGKVRTFHIANELVKKGHEIFLLQPSENSFLVNEVKYPFKVHEVEVNKKNYLFNVFKIFLSGLKYFRENSITHMISENLWIFPLAYLISVILKTKLILDEHNIEYLRAISIRNIRNFIYGWLNEFILIKKCAAICFVTENEKKFMEKLLPKKIETMIVPNGTNIVPSKSESLKYNYYNQKIKQQYNINNNKLLALFVGDISYKPNLNAVKILNTIAKNLYSKVQFLVVGKYTKKIVSNMSNIIFTGFIDDISTYLYGCDCSIIPIFSGGGTNLKVLEALTVGLPIVCSTFAIKGIKVDENNTVIISNDFNNYHNIILKNYKKIVATTQNRKFDKRFSWSNAINTLDDYLKKY